MKTILLAYDDSRSGEVALRRAAEYTARLNADLIVQTVAPLAINTGRMGGRTDPVDSPARRDQVLANARAFLEERGIEARYVRSIGHPADTIVKTAKAYGADLIIVGQRGTNPIKRLLGLNVSERVIDKARCAVLMARPSKIAADEAAATVERLPEPVESAHERLAA